MRHLIIGDIHGCYDELQQLIKQAGLQPEDRIIALGDIADRGHYTPKVIEFFMKNDHAVSLLGNHERKHLRSRRGQTRAAASQVIARQQIGEDNYPAVLDYFESMPLYIELDEAILVHGFIEPGVELSQQRENVLTGVMTGADYLEKTYNQSWYELYDRDKPLICGHRNYTGTDQPFIYRDLVYAIDTSCAKGGSLTGILLPDFRIIQVKSARDYWQELRAQHTIMNTTGLPFEQWKWKKIDEILQHVHATDKVPDHVCQQAESLEEIRNEGYRLITILIKQVTQENDRILSVVRTEQNYDDLPFPEQARVYAAHIGPRLLANLLHLARQGRLNRETIKQRYKTLKSLRKAITKLWGQQ